MVIENGPRNKRNKMNVSSLEELFDSCYNPLVMFTIPGCKNCSKMCIILENLKRQLSEGAFTYQVIDISAVEFEDVFDVIIEELCALSGDKRTFPKLFFKRSYIGDYDDLKRKYDFDGLQFLLNMMGVAYPDEYDF